MQIIVRLGPTITLTFLRVSPKALHAEIPDMDIGSPQCRVFDSAKDAVADADVIVVATSSPSELLRRMPVAASLVLVLTSE